MRASPGHGASSSERFPTHRLLNRRIGERARSHQNRRAEEYGAHASVSADEAAR